MTELTITKWIETKGAVHVSIMTIWSVLTTKINHKSQSHLKSIESWYHFKQTKFLIYKAHYCARIYPLVQTLLHNIQWLCKSKSKLLRSPLFVVVKGRVPGYVSFKPPSNTAAKAPFEREAPRCGARGGKGLQPLSGSASPRRGKIDLWEIVTKRKFPWINDLAPLLGNFAPDEKILATPLMAPW